MIFTATFSVDEAGAADHTWTVAQLAAARTVGCPSTVSADPSHWDVWSVQCTTLSGSTSVNVKGKPASGGVEGAEQTLNETAGTDDEEVVVVHNGLAYSDIKVSVGGAYTGTILVRFSGYRGAR